MKRFVAGADRAQSTLLPESLDDWVDESNPVRVIDAFVDALNVGELGFEGRQAGGDGAAVFSSFIPLEALHLWLSSSLAAPQMWSGGCQGPRRCPRPQGGGAAHQTEAKARQEMETVRRAAS